ncbi:MAG TPA: hypothetical protein VF041_20310 [Gemmatimonadaceae bacterium]
MRDFRSVRHTILSAAALLGAVALPARAQSGPGPVAVGISAAAFDWTGGHAEQALGAIVQLAPTPWLVLGANPTLLRVSDPRAGDAQAGFGDLPAYAGLTHQWNAPWQPVLGVAGVVTFPTGDASRGLGRGESLVSAEGALALSPLSVLTVRGGASRLLRVGGERPTGVATTALFGDAVLLAGARSNVSIGYALELRGDAPATYDPARAISATLVHALAGQTALTLSAARTLRGAGPTWSFAIGIGSAFSGLSPVGATSPAARSSGGSMREGPGKLLPVGVPTCGLGGGC